MNIEQTIHFEFFFGNFILFLGTHSVFIFDILSHRADFNRGGPDEFDRRQMAAGQPNRDYFVPNRFGMPGMNNSSMGLIRGNLQQFGPRNNSPMFMWGPRAGWYHLILRFI